MAILTSFNEASSEASRSNAADVAFVLRDTVDIVDFLKPRGIFFEQWQASCAFSPDAPQEEVLAAYAPVLEPYMARNGYQTADVIVIHPETPNLDALRAKFLREHTHTEDEVRFFVEGEGDFWFNLETHGQSDADVFCVRCQQGDLLAVPAGYKHWFDMGENPRVKTIRIFTDASGWTPHYTDSGMDARYRLPESFSQVAGG